MSIEISDIYMFVFHVYRFPVYSGNLIFAAVCVFTLSKVGRGYFDFSQLFRSFKTQTRPDQTIDRSISCGRPSNSMLLLNSFSDGLTIDTIVTGIGNAIKTFGTLLVMPRPSKLKIGQNNGKIKLKI